MCHDAHSLARENLRLVALGIFRQDILCLLYGFVKLLLPDSLAHGLQKGFGTGHFAGGWTVVRRETDLKYRAGPGQSVSFRFEDACHIKCVALRDSRRYCKFSNKANVSYMKAPQTMEWGLKAHCQNGAANCPAVNLALCVYLLSIRIPRCDCLPPIFFSFATLTEVSNTYLIRFSRIREQHTAPVSSVWIPIRQNEESWTTWNHTIMARMAPAWTQQLLQVLTGPAHFSWRLKSF